MRLTQACETCDIDDGDLEVALPVGTLLRVEDVFLLDGAQGFQIFVQAEQPDGSPIGEAIFLDQGDRHDGQIIAEFVA